MPAENSDLHGNAPDKASVALLLIDVINDLEFPEADQLLPHAVQMARQIAALKRRIKQAELLGPRTALTGVPSGAVIESGTPKNARKYSEGVSRTIRRSAGADAAVDGLTATSLPDAPDRARR